MEEELAFRDYLLRVATGDPSKLQIMYGIGGERRLTEFELDDFPGYEGSRPVRIGNAAFDQFQLDVYGEVAIVSCAWRSSLGQPVPERWSRWLALLDHVESIWREPDDGIWEVRGPRRQFTHSKVMAWVVFDRPSAGRAASTSTGSVDRWKQIRARDPRAGLRARLRPRAGHVHAVLRLAGARRERARHPAASGSCRRTTSG